ncbi:hypothetical protein PPS11_01749 [Pseudomonas putida S11]|nr:hypothetical protein PPS11_01749 [Pseudomonas putida S11]
MIHVQEWKRFQIIPAQLSLQSMFTGELRAAYWENRFRSEENLGVQGVTYAIKCNGNIDILEAPGLLVIIREHLKANIWEAFL